MYIKKDRTISPKILIIGSLPPPLGGTAVSLMYLLESLKSYQRLDVRIINTSGIRGNILKNLFEFLRTVFRIIISVSTVDVITLHVATTALPFFGLFLLIITRLAGKPLIIRKFAGFDYMNLGPLKGRLAHFVIRHADFYLTQTKRLVHLTKKRGVRNVEWYPTSRPMPKSLPVSKVQDRYDCRRFVYVGQVREYKGIHELIAASEQFDEKIMVDIYGPLFDDLGKDIFENCKRVKYCGVLKPEEVIPTFGKYDMLLLPTKAETEGYPGVILEGFAAGLPVIASSCGAIPEIVDTTSGILIEPGNVKALFNAMKKISDDAPLYAGLKAGVKEKRKGFSSDFWAKRFLDLCCESVDKKNEF